MPNSHFTLLSTPLLVPAFIAMSRCVHGCYSLLWHSTSVSLAHQSHKFSSTIGLLGPLHFYYCPPGAYVLRCFLRHFFLAAINSIHVSQPGPHSLRAPVVLGRWGFIPQCKLVFSQRSPQQCDALSPLGLHSRPA